MAKLRINDIGGAKIWMETFPTYNILSEICRGRIKVEYKDPTIKFNRLYHGSADLLTIDQINDWFKDKKSFYNAMLYGDNKEWILITKEE